MVLTGVHSGLLFDGPTRVGLNDWVSYYSFIVLIIKSDTKLHQTMSCYLITMLSTPIFIDFTMYSTQTTMSTFLTYDS